MAERYNRDDDDDRPQRSNPDRDDDERPRRRDRDDDREPPAQRPAKKGMSTGLIIGIVVGVLLICVAAPIALVLPGVSKVRTAASRAKESNNLKQMGLAAHAYHDSNSRLTNGPYAGFASPNTELSFRVELLPYMEQDYLYKQFRTDEAWDSATNRPLANTPVPPLVSPIDPPGTVTTRYRGFVGPGSVFEPGAKVNMTSIVDGLSNTIYVVMADDGVIWSKPEELYYTANGPLPTIGQKSYSGGTLILLCDGSVKMLSNKTSETVMRALITRNGGEELPPDW